MAEFKQPVSSRLQRLGALRHLRANYEKHTRAICFLFGPMGLFEGAGAVKAGERRGNTESSIMMTTFLKASESRLLTETRESVYLCLPAGSAQLCLSLINVNVSVLLLWGFTVRAALD
ncbi:hypothetical protein ABVT39_000164 [Epinephelus coioides]